MKKAAKKVEVLAVSDKPAQTGISQVSPVLAQAIQAGASVEVLERLLALQERWDANEARKAFEAAMSEARMGLPTIVKSSKVDFTNKAGQRTNYKYEELATITEAVTPVLSQHGLTFRWQTDSETVGAVKVSCVVSHAAGHAERTTLSCGLDHSGNKNDIQAIGSAVTYLQRYTLKAALGIAAGVDDDGRSVKGAEDGQPGQSETKQPETENEPERPGSRKERQGQAWESTVISEPQRKRLYAIASKSGRKEEALKAWLKACGLDSSKEIQRRDYDAVVSAVEAPGPLKVMVLKVRDREPGEEG